MSEPVSSHNSSSSPSALLAGFSQSTRILKLSTPLGADVLLAECVRDEEGIGTGFSFKISSRADATAASSRT